jgi:MGT family glycosyltransferase
MSVDKPWIYVSEGTVHTQTPFVSRAAAQGLGPLPVQVIITSSWEDSAENLSLGWSNVLVEHWTKIHYQDVLPHTSIVISTGGGGTVMAALQAGVPLIVIPTEWDKPEIAQRVVAAGAGIRIPAWRCTADRLRAAVQRVLADPSFRENACRLAQSFKPYKGAVKAAELLENLSDKRLN